MSVKPRLPEIDLRLPFPELPPDQPVPAKLKLDEIGLPGARRRKLHAILAGLKARGAQFSYQRGALSTTHQVERLEDAVCWLIDETQLLSPKGDK